jgi:multiple sugar transport system permease protein
MMNYKTQKRTINIMAYVIAFVALVFTFFPIMWIFSISTKKPLDAFARPPKIFIPPIWDNYTALLDRPGFVDAFTNSLVITALGVVLALLIAIPAAYAINRLRFFGKRFFMFWLLLSYMFPQFLFIVPMYVLYQTLGLYDTHVGLALAYQVAVLPFAIWLIRGFFKEVPVELEDAARCDGLGGLGLLWYVYVPLSAPGLAATAILCAIWIWNELTIALALTFSQAQTVTLAIAGFRGYTSLDWGGMAAASIVVILPMLLFVFIAQRYLVSGLTLGAVK